jgi:hypothetical protein
VTFGRALTVGEKQFEIAAKRAWMVKTPGNSRFVVGQDDFRVGIGLPFRILVGTPADATAPPGNRILSDV